VLLLLLLLMLPECGWVHAGTALPSDLQYELFHCVLCHVVQAISLGTRARQMGPVLGNRGTSSSVFGLQDATSLDLRGVCFHIHRSFMLCCSSRSLTTGNAQNELELLTDKQ
jgi:hypothetical protein